jgi:TonB family protein
VAVVASPELSRGGNFQQPKFITGPSPAIPPLAAGELGPSEVNLEATVDRRGIVTNVLVLSGHPLLVSAATRAVLKWHFQPATLDGQPFEIKVRIRVKYEANRR